MDLFIIGDIGLVRFEAIRLPIDFIFIFLGRLLLFDFNFAISLDIFLIEGVFVDSFPLGLVEILLPQVIHLLIVANYGAE